MRSPLRAVVGWPAEFAERYRAAGYWTETFDAFLGDRAERYADRPAVVGVSAARPGERTALTYAQLRDAVGRLAGLLAGRGVEPGDRVLLQLPNCVDYVVAVFAVFRLGALPVFALPAHREREIGQFAQIADAAAYVFAGTGWGYDFTGLAERVAAELTAAGHVPPQPVDLAGWELDSTDVDPVVAPPEVASTDIAFLQMSGGTTGVPKLVPRTHADYLYSVRASADICGLDRATVMLVSLPAAHNFPMSSPGLLGVLDRGGTVVLAPDPSPRTCFGLIERERVTITSLVPPLAQAWLASAARPTHTADLSSLRLIQVGGARLADSVARRITPELGCPLQQVYGMAEGLVCYTRSDDPAELVTTSQGRPISVDDELRIDPETGELSVRGPYTIRGYYGTDAAVQADHFTADGFYRTGDVVAQLPSGHLQVTGRIKDQINRGGDKIAVDEVEDLLLQHTGVHDAAVVSVPDPYLGERICVFVVPREPAAEPTLAELRSFLSTAGLAAYKQPDELRVVPDFPATAPGKVNRRRLRASLAASHRK